MTQKEGLNFQKLSSGTNTYSHHKPFWDVCSSLKCPIIGMSFSVDKQRRILKKAGFNTKGKTPYQIHRTIMAHLDGENKVSIKTDHCLKHKYRTAYIQYKDLEEDELLEIWKDGLQRGEIEGLLYTIASRSDVSDSFLLDVYGEVHMIGHYNMEETMKSRKHLEALTDVNQRLLRRLDTEKTKSKVLIHKNKKLLKQMNEERSRIVIENRMETQNSNEGGITEKEKCNDNVFEAKFQYASKQLNNIEREKRKIEIKMFELQSTNHYLVEEINSLIAQISKPFRCIDECSETCPKFHLCEKRILIVGGITKIKQFYKRFVESHGGEVDYHDGYMKGGNKNLEQRVSKSDLILCPVNCNSHNACNRVKKMCKKYNKPLKMLPSSSLTAVSNALIESFSGLN